ncbi:MAG: NACHT domain-containing protein [Lysobacteraceae bacterium]|nr:MAG: NACHT domain-containing protein [Xanthomonadaceae bacterium]
MTAPPSGSHRDGDDPESLRRKIAELTAQLAQAEARPLIETEGGAVVGQGVRVSNGHFIGRDWIQHIHQTVHAGEQEEDLQNFIALYLHSLGHRLGLLPLGEIDATLDQNRRQPLQLGDVYVPLNTTLQIDEEERLQDFLDDLQERVKFVGSDRGLPYLRATAGKKARFSQFKDAQPDGGFRDILSDKATLRPVTALEALAAHSSLTLLGKPGGGKSSFCARVLLALAEAARGHPEELRHLGEGWSFGALFPIHIELRRFADQLPQGDAPATAGDLWDHLSRELHARGIGPGQAELRFLQRLTQRHGALVVFDGLDECGDRQRRQRVQAAVRQFIDGYRDRCRFVLTMRPYAWPQETPDPLQGVYALDGFDDTQVQQFIGAWYAALPQRGWCLPEQAAEKHQDLLAARDRPDLAELASTPLLLTLMSLLHSNRGRLPDDRADLYHESVELLLQRWNHSNSGAEKTLREQLGMPQLRLSDVRVVLQRLAFTVHARSVGRKGELDIGEHELLDALRPLFGGSYDQAGVMLRFIEQRAGLLAGQGQRDGVHQFTFPHRTFREYLAACYLGGSRQFSSECLRLTQDTPDHWAVVLPLAAKVAGPDHGAAAADALVDHQDIGAFCRTCTPGPMHWRRAELAGLQLHELGQSLLQTQPHTQQILQRVRGWLAAALPVHPDDGGLRAPQRARIGHVLTHLGDPRFDPQRFYLPADDALGFVRIPADPEFRIGVSPADRARIEQSLAKAIDDDKINDQPTPTPEFWIARYPVTVAQFRAFVRHSGYQAAPKEALQGPDNHPVSDVRWNDAQAYVGWLHQRLHEIAGADAPAWADLIRRQGWRVALPSEREWEKAARGGRVGQVFSWGDHPDPERANYRDTGIQGKAPVGSFPANDFGLYDMLGNAWEWTRSGYAAYPPSEIEVAPGHAGLIVVRGGAWHSPRYNARCAFRSRPHPGGRGDGLGFRVVLCVSPVRSSGLGKL